MLLQKAAQSTFFSIPIKDSFSSLAIAIEPSKSSNLIYIVRRNHLVLHLILEWHRNSFPPSSTSKPRYLLKAVAPLLQVHQLVVSPESLKSCKYMDPAWISPDILYHVYIICMHVHTHTHIYIYICIYTHIYICMEAPRNPSPPGCFNTNIMAGAIRRARAFGGPPSSFWWPRVKRVARKWTTQLCTST